MAQLNNLLVTGASRFLNIINGTITNSEKVNNHTVDKDVPSNAVFTDTTYESKAAASGGTAVSLVTTGEKYTWNNKGSGTITGITMNGSSKGTSGVVDLGTVITAHQDISGKLNTSLKGAANGLAELDANGKVPSAQLPSYVDDVLEYSAKASFPATGETGKIYVDTTTNLTYRWGGSAYVEISPSLALGETSSTAYRGDRGSAAYTHAVTNKGSAFSSGLYKITTNSEGHVTAATAVAKADITGLGIPAQDTTYESKTAASEGTDVSLVTTGEKYTWNNKSDLANLVDGSIPGSVRGTYTTPESENYTIGYYAFAEGMATKASGIAAHAEGRNNAATGDYSHVEGRVSTASGDYSHAEGHGTTASGEASHAEGNLTIANHQSQHVFGEYNIADDSTSAATSKGTYVEIVGNGISVSARSNARTLDWDGNEILAGTLTTGTSLQNTTDDNKFVGVLVKTDIDTSVVPSEANQWYRVFGVKDIDGELRSYFGAVDTTNMGQGVQMETRRIVNDSEVYNGVQLRIKDDGSCNVAVSDAAAWRNAIGAINKAGDTMTGDLILSDGNFYLDTDQFTLGTTPSENIYPLNRIYFRDANGNHVGQLYHHYLSNGQTGVLIEAKRSINNANVYNTMRLSIDDSGNKIVALSDSGTPFRKALGLGTDGALPITIDQGGTGATTRLDAFKNLTAQDVGADAQYFVTLTQNWAKAGYSNRLNAFKAMNNANVGADVTHLVTLKSDWTKGGYSSLQQVRKAMGLGDTTGAVPVANGGTGLTAAPSMLTNLGSTTAAGIFAASPRPGITGTLAVAHGGTGATEKPACITNLGGKPWISIGSFTSTTSKTITFSGTARAVLIAAGTATARQGMWIIYGLVGTPVVTAVKTASNLTVTAGTNKVTLTSSSTANASSYLLVLDGYDNITVT